METSQVPSSPLKINTKEYVDTPSSSATSSPVESCASDVVKQLKPWASAANDANSVDSSEASESQSGDDMEAEVEDEAEPEGSIKVENSSKVDAPSLRMQMLVWSMQQRLRGLQRLVQEAAPQDRRPRATKLEDPEEGTSRYKLFLVEKDALDGDESVSLGRCVQDLPLVDEATDNADEQEVENSSENEAPSMSMLLNRMKTLEAQLKDAAEENQQLQNTVHRLEEENTRLQAQTVCNSPKGSSVEFNGDGGSTESGREQNSIADETDKAGDGGISRLSSVIFGNPSAFQVVIEKDMAVELERNTMRIQRDEAIAEVERADAENVKLACSSNPQRKIKYLEQVKKDNQELRRKNRALNVRITKQAAKFIREKNGCSVLEDEVDVEASHDTLDPATLDDSLLQESAEPSCGRTSEEILRSMLSRRGVMEQRLERLRMAKQDLSDIESDGDDSSDECELPATATYVSAVQGSANVLLGAQG